jgi:hypothetical protein
MRVERISVRVMVGDAPPQQKRHDTKKLSSENASLICQTAEGIGDKDLRAALKRLGRHV